MLASLAAVGLLLFGLIWDGEGWAAMLFDCLSGAIAMGFIVAGLLVLRIRSADQDRRASYFN